MADYITELRKLIGTRPIIMCGAGALIIDGQNRVLLQRRCDNDCWGIPGGAVELGETIEETARREVQEETGLTLGEIALFGAYSGPELHYIYPNGDEVHIISHVFMTHEYCGEIVAGAAESKDVRFFQFDELPHINPPDQPVIRDFLRKHGGGPARSACPPGRPCSLFDALWQVSAGLARRFPEGNDPFQMVTRLAEECGELAEQVSHFESTGIKRQKLGEPDRRKLAKDVQDVIRCVLQLTQHYGVRPQLEESIDHSFEALQSPKATWG